MRFYFRAISSILAASFLLLSSAAFADRAVSDFNLDWRFTQGEQPGGVTGLTFDDSQWDPVNLPHDWAIAGPFNPDENGYAGKLPWRGVGWYRKIFQLSAGDAGRRVYFDFDGVMAFPKVYINGSLAGEWDYGYMSFRVDATPYVKFGEENVIAVMADTRQHGTRWYPGAGIYRKVVMSVCDPVHIAHWGVFISTPEVSDESAVVRIRVSIENHESDDAPIEVNAQLIDPGGRGVVDGAVVESIPSHGAHDSLQFLTVERPLRWDIDAPNLYRALVTLKRDGKTIDSKMVSFGIRSYEFTADDGFHLNGRRVQLYGVNLHHDQGPLGAAFYPRAMRRQLEIMRDMGCNALRTSHNPPAPEVLEICDELGIVVWNESFDKWNSTADRLNGVPLEEHGEKQIRNFVMRDRNHPSVVLWSIGNEIGNQPYDKEGKSPERVRYMSDFVRKYDPTRPVGMGCFIPSTADEPILDALDLTGWNYARRYANYRDHYPNKPILYSESASALSTRGFYELPLATEKTDYSAQHQVDSYDRNAAPWSDIPDREFKLMEDDDFVAGEFVWTGFDYLGEPTPFPQEARSSYFGIVDLCGIPKDRFYLYRSYWRPDALTVHILPHWNWNDRIGQPVPVYVYTNGDSAELFLNGKSLGMKTKAKTLTAPETMTQNQPASASTEELDKGNSASLAVDGDPDTRWCASNANPDQWWQVDLGAVKPVRFIEIEFQQDAQNYQYHVDASTDGQSWETLVVKNGNERKASRVAYNVDARARYLRVQFTRLRRNAWASIVEFTARDREAESSYYLPMNKYRLRWNDVVYQPGELKAVAYSNGVQIGEAVMRTAGEPASLHLTPDRARLNADGYDLSYILVEALDDKGTLCPLADNKVEFTLDGPGEIAGVGNGNPLSLEPFQANYRKLFYGKAMLIVRTKPSETGAIRITAKSEGLRDASVRLTAE